MMSSAHAAVRLTAVIAVLLVALTALLPAVNACSCMPSHPQTFYCNADYVIIARILRQRRDDDRITYKIAVKKAYKMNERARDYLSDGKLHTAASDSMCGRPLTVGKLYVIAGRSATVSLCSSYAQQYISMSLVERRGFANGYRKGCACDIQMSARSGPVPGECAWDPWDRCQTRLGACVPSRAGFNATARPSKCHWRSSPLYNECVNEP